MRAIAKQMAVSVMAVSRYINAPAIQCTKSVRITNGEAPRIRWCPVRAVGQGVQSPCVLLMAESSALLIKAVWGRRFDGVLVGGLSERVS